MKTWLWKLNAGTAGLCLLVGGSDIALGHWPLVIPVAGACGINSLLARNNYRKAHPAPRAHKPDYAKIARLEVELGLVPDPVAPNDFYAPPAVPAPGVNASLRMIHLNGGFLTYVGTPQAGNPPIEAVGKVGPVDPFGNPVPGWAQSRPVIAKPDHPCSLCIPGRPATNCPFNSICQT